uniref:Uncharacterized protein n=1 Tax=Mycena chlorophos TaxID=658473 RepID=A0ABQ0LGW1_MYCCL|nr:predicted protein [Mycena chlorophos]
MNLSSGRALASKNVVAPTPPPTSTTTDSLGSLAHSKPQLSKLKLRRSLHRERKPPLEPRVLRPLIILEQVQIRLGCDVPRGMRRFEGMRRRWVGNTCDELEESERTYCMRTRAARPLGSRALDGIVVSGFPDASTEEILKIHTLVADSDFSYLWTRSLNQLKEVGLDRCAEAGRYMELLAHLVDVLPRRADDSDELRRGADDLGNCRHRLYVQQVQRRCRGVAVVELGEDHAVRLELDDAREHELC